MSKENSSHYQDAKNFIDSLPQSWMPALLLHFVQVAYEKKVFVPGGASRIIAKCEQSQDIPTPSDVDALAYELLEALSPEGYEPEDLKTVRDVVAKVLKL